MDDKNRNLVLIGVAFLIGLLVGWFVLGWGIFPVSYTNANLSDVRPDQQKLYLEAVAVAYELTGDREATTERLEKLGSQEYVANLAAEQMQEAEASGDFVTADRIEAMANAVGLSLAGAAQPGAEEQPAPEDQPEEGAGNAGDILAGVCRAGLGLLVILGAIVLGLWLLRQRSARSEESEAAAPEPIQATASPTQAASAPATAPVAAAQATRPARGGLPSTREYVATFNLGDVSYDQSFDIEDQSGGGYLGECGMTMSELVGGDPNRVTALEVWLFDKSDIRTVTKVLMSDYAYGNQAMREKLASRGDALLLEPNLGFILDAQTLRMEGQVLELDYDETEAPMRSTVRRLVVQLRVTRQQS